MVSVEKDFQHYQYLRKVAQILKDAAWKPLMGDVFKFIRPGQQPTFDIIFADPPYALPHLTEIPDHIFASNLLKPDGIFILEHGKGDNFAAHPHFIDHRSYGSVNFSFFQQK